MKKLLIIILAIVGLLFLVGIIFYNSSPTNEAGKKVTESNFKVGLYIPKIYPDGLQLVDLSNLENPKEPYRTVSTANGEEKVSLVEGHRALYSYPGKLPLLKIFVEKGAPGNFDNDKTVIDREFVYLVKQYEGKDPGYSYSKKQYKGYEYYVTGNPASRETDTVEIATIFFPKDNVIATIYFFNQGPDPAKRSFETTEQYLQLRDKFIYQLIDNVAVANP